MRADFWITDKVSRLNKVIYGKQTATISHALSVRIPRTWEFTRVCLPPVINTLREQFMFWCKDISNYVSAGYLVGWKRGWRKPQGLWRMRFMGSSFDFILNNKMATVVSPVSGSIATIHIRERFLKSSMLEVSTANLGTLRIIIPLLCFHPLTYMVIADEENSSFRVLFQWEFSGYAAFGGQEIVKKVPSFEPSSLPLQNFDEVSALLFHPDDLNVVSRVCERWPPALLTCLCIWAKCFETPRNLYS